MSPLNLLPSANTTNSASSHYRVQSFTSPVICEQMIAEDEEESDDVSLYTTPIVEEYASDDSDSPVRSSVKCSVSHSVRHLHTVRSSPQLLKQIHEESEDEVILLPRRTATAYPYKSPRHIMSPNRRRKYDRRQKRLTHGSSGKSCSSSDASDTDETDTRKRKDKLKGRFHRKDSSDHSSDTDGPSGPGAPPGGGRECSNSGGNDGDSGKHDTHNEDDNDRNNQHNNQKGNSKKGGTRQANATMYSCNTGHTYTIMENNPTLGTSNLSVNSTPSSLTSRNGKYVVADNNRSDSLVEALNKENKDRNCVIHVRSKDFNDLMTRFSNNKHKQNDKSVSSRRRNKDKIRTDINCNGIINHCANRSDHMAGRCVTDHVTTVTTKCCSLV